MLQNVWVSPRGREYAVANHTSWLEKLFRTRLPPVEDVEHEIEKNRLYDMAVRANWLKGQIDYHRRALYIDPYPLTGDHWRWLAKRGAADNLRILNTDGKELADFQPGKRKKRRDETIARRLSLAVGAPAYVCEAIDVKEFIVNQPVFNIWKYGKYWAVAVDKPVPEALRRIGHSSHAPLLGFLEELSEDRWVIRDVAIRYQSVGGHLVGKIYPTKEAAAEALWQAIGKHMTEAAPKSVKDWILNLKVPPARDTEYRVEHQPASHAPDSTYTYTFKTLEKAFAFALILVREGHARPWPNPEDKKPTTIEKIYLPTATTLAKWIVRPQGDLVPVPVSEGVDVKDFIDRQAGITLYYITEYVVNFHDDRETRPLRVGYETEMEKGEAEVKRVATHIARSRARIPDHPVVRVELECWSTPISHKQTATLEHTYWVKPDGTFEEISGPADASRAGVVS